MRVNAWLAISDAAVGALKTRLQWDEEADGPYTGPVPDEAYQIFRKLIGGVGHGLNVVQKFWSTPTIAGKTWNLFSVYFDSETLVDEAIIYLETEYGNNFVVAGAWNYDTGAIIRAPHAQLIQFMPAGATELTDVNLEQGQAPRVFA